MPIDEAGRRIAAGGFDAVDANLVMIRNKTLRLHTDDWKYEAEKIALAVQETGIELAQCHLPFRGKKVKCHTPEDLEYYYKMFYRAIDVAGFLGIPWGVIHPETFRGQNLSDEECCRLNHEANDKYIEYALNKGVNIAYENMTLGAKAGYCTYIDQLVDLIDSYADPRIGACLDTGHANMVYEDQYEPILKLGHRLHCTHINDNLGKDDLHLAPFSGTVKWESVIKGLREINYPGALNLEIGLNNEATDKLKDAGAKYALETLKAIESL
jgi:sugar phosphate isomerase/epimerase